MIITYSTQKNESSSHMMFAFTCLPSGFRLLMLSIYRNSEKLRQHRLTYIMSYECPSWVRGCLAPYLPCGFHACLCQKVFFNIKMEASKSVSDFLVAFWPKVETLHISTWTLFIYSKNLKHNSLIEKDKMALTKILHFGWQSDLDFHQSYSNRTMSKFDEFKMH